MKKFLLGAEVIAVPPGSPEGRAVLTAYFRDIVSRYCGREATSSEVAAAMNAEPSDDLAPPTGALLIARHGADILGCAGLRLLPAGIGEVTRVFVLPQARRRGVGGLLLCAVEDMARCHAVSRLRLDTRSDLAGRTRSHRPDG